jgi:hypothetical protein
MDKLQSLDPTAEEFADWERERSERKALEQVRFANDSEKLRTRWDDGIMELRRITSTGATVFTILRRLRPFPSHGASLSEVPR